MPLEYIRTLSKGISLLQHKHGGIPLKQYTTTSYRDKYIQDQMHEITSRGSEIDPLTNLQYKHLVAPG